MGHELGTAEEARNTIRSWSLNVGFDIRFGSTRHLADGGEKSKSCLDVFYRYVQPTEF